MPTRSEQRYRAGTSRALATLVAALLALLAVSPAEAAVDAEGARPGAALTAPERYPVRGMYQRDFSRTGFETLEALGFNYIDSGPSRDFDALAARGLKGFVWLGGYSNSSCTFREDDDWVETRVRRIAGHPGVGAYFIDDEPDAADCPNAPAQMRARSQLVKSIDPTATTFLVTYKLEQIQLFAGTVDVIGLDRYPCTIRRGCDFSRIDRQAAEADRLGIRYWGVLQAWGDDWYKLPTAEEIHLQFERWRRTNMEGYLVFAWRYPDDMPDLWLANHPKLQAQLALENRGPPNTRVTAGPGQRTKSRKATFRFVSTVPRSTFRCKLDRQRWQACASPKVYRGLTGGTHTFNVRARDVVGNVDPSPARRSWRVR